MADWEPILKLLGLLLFFGVPMFLGWWHDTFAPYIVVHLRNVGHLKCMNLADMDEIDIDGIPIQIQHRTLKPLMHMEAGDLKITLAAGSAYEDAYARLWFFRGAEPAREFFHGLIQQEHRLRSS